MVNEFPNDFCFIFVPYLAMFIFVVGTILRYRWILDSCASLTSQFREKHFWALAPFHYGVVIVLLGHIVAFVLPHKILKWNSQPLRLYILEVTALIFGLLTVVGLVGAILRRWAVPKVRRATNGLDWLVLALLLVQAASGVGVAIFHPWGSSWFAAALSPYLWSLLRFSPNLGYVALMPSLVRVHIVLAYVIIGIAPFTRLVHILVAPNPYLWRRPQVVRWQRASKEAA